MGTRGRKGIMRKIVFIFTIFIATNLWSKEDIHLFTLKCESEGSNWGVLTSSKNSYFYIDVHLAEPLKDDTKMDHLLGKRSQDAFTKIYYLDKRVWWHSFVGGKIIYDLTSYELTNTTHPKPYPQIEKGPYNSLYSWIDFHQGRMHPHSIVIDRISLEATFVFHDNPITLDSKVRPKYSYHKTKCDKANKGEPQKWEKEINSPLDEAIERKRQEIIKKRKI